jgi:hypothetical protein
MKPQSLATVMIAAAAAMAQIRTDTVMSHTATGVPVVKAYLLTAAEENCFSRTDGPGSFFWTAWDQNSQLDKATVLSIQANLARGLVPDDVNDCKVTIKAAYGERGAYLLIELMDNVWMGVISGTDYINDAVEVFTEKHSSSYLYSHQTLFKDINISQLTETYMQLQICFGGVDQLERFSYNYYYPAVTGSPLTQPMDFVVYNRNIIFDEADQTYGMKIEVLPTVSGEENIRREEWLIPWSVWGGPNDPPLSAKPAVGAKLAFTFGYNDKDLFDEPQASCLRWKNAADPYTTATKSTGTVTTVDSWGDMEFSDSLNKAMAGYSLWLSLSGQCNPTLSRPPYFTSTPITSATEDSLYRYAIAAADSDQGDTATISLVSGPTGMVLSGKVLTWTPVNSLVGAHAVTVRATDNHGVSADQTFQITVANVNDAPVITSVPPASISAGAQYRYQVMAADLDAGDVLSYSLDSAQTGMIISASGLLTWTASTAGSYRCRIRVTDRAGAFVTQGFTITVRNPTAIIGQHESVPLQLMIEPCPTGFVAGIPQTTGNPVHVDVLSTDGKVLRSIVLARSGYYRVDLDGTVHAMRIVRMVSGRKSLVKRLFLP